MTASRGWYSLIQFCPDPSRAEAVNVGVILFCPERRFISARTTTENGRARKLFGADTFDPFQLNAAKKAIEERLEVERDRFRTLDDLQKFIDTRANEIVISPPRPTRVESPEQDLASLFDELVGGRAQRRKPSPAVAILDAAFRRLEPTKRVFVNHKFTVPVIERELVAPYAYRNGQLNLVKPETFSSDPTRAENTGLRLAAEAELIAEHSKQAGQDAELVVVSVAADDGPAHEVEQRLARLFKAFGVAFVPRAGIDKFVRKVERDVKSH